MSEPLVVIGAGGFGREALGVVSAINSAGGVNAEPPFKLLGILDDDPSTLNLARLAALGVRHLGTITDWLAESTPALFAVCIGSPTVRATVAGRFEERGHRAATLVDPRAHLGALTQVAVGSIICAGVEISTNVTIGRHVHVNPHVTIGHDTVIEDFVSINPAATVSGDVTVESGTLVGAAAVILQGLTVHAGSLVGAAACVVRDVPSGTTVKGVPAR